MELGYVLRPGQNAGRGLAQAVAMETLEFDEDVVRTAEELKRCLKRCALAFGVPPHYFVVADRHGRRVDYFPKVAYPGLDAMISTGGHDDRNAPA